MSTTITRRLRDQGMQDWAYTTWIHWGAAWGDTWKITATNSQLFLTPRVTDPGEIIGNWTHQTSRISGLLALEGDAAPGTLLLEGDAQSGTDSLKLEGDASITAMTAANTRRVTDTEIVGNWTQQTSRLSFLLALEGDAASGTLLLEGDAQSGTDSLKLEGDANIMAVTPNHTKRVATPVDAAVAA